MYLLDTNILIDFLKGDEKIVNWVIKQREETPLYISTISKLEILSLKFLTEKQIKEIKSFLETFHLLWLNNDIIEISALLRRKTGLNVADSIIGATAINFKFTLITRDKIFQRKIKPFLKVSEI